MIKATIIWTASAKTELRKIYQYYKDKASIALAQKIKNNILFSPEILKTHPLAGQEEESLKALQEGHRYLVEGNYKIIYKVVEKKIFLTDVFDSRQNPAKLKKKK